MKNRISLNNRLIVETYKKEALEAETSSGFAFIAQKNKVKGLKVLLHAKLQDGTQILSGSLVYIKEETLHTAPWAQKVYNADLLSVPFMIVDINQVEFVAEPEAKDL